MALRQNHILSALLSAIAGVPHHRVEIVKKQVVMKPEKKHLTKNQLKANRRRDR